jgi:polysaccharide export outer membrane protein
MPYKPFKRFQIAVVGGFFLAGSITVPRAQAQASVENSLPVLPTPAAAPPTAAPAAAPPSANSPESAYALGAGDIVKIDIFRVPQYSGESQVLVDGSLNLPLVGKVNVNGLSLEEASATLSSQYSRFLRRPLITMSLITRRPLQIGIAGEVNRPGSYTLGQETTQPSRLSQLIETAGGITQSADLSQVQVRRQQANGSQQVVTVDLWDLITNGNLSQDVTLRDGDAVFIPTALVPLENAALLADASFATDTAQPINIAIIGEVYRPGPYTLQGGGGSTGEAGTPGETGSANTPTTVTGAIQVAGGIKPQADIREVQIVRATRAGAPQTFNGANDCRNWSVGGS